MTSKDALKDRTGPPGTRQQTLGEKPTPGSPKPSLETRESGPQAVIEWRQLKPIAQVSLIRTGPGRKPAE